MHNPSFQLYSPPLTADNTIPYPEGIDRVYYRSQTFADTAEWNLLSHMPALRYLYVYSNVFPTGTTWSALSPAGDVSGLIYLYLVSNQNISGDLPAAWSTLSQLQRLYLDRNPGTTPSVPASWTTLTRLRYVYVRSMGWSTAQVDQFLSDFATRAATGLGFAFGAGKRLYIGNSGSSFANGSPTGGATNPSIVALQNMGWTVYL